MKKLEKDQLPKVIALGVMVAGLLGYMGYTWLGHGAAAPAPAVASTARPAPVRPAAQPQAGSPAAPVNPLLALAPIDHENPFIPAFQAMKAPAPPPAAPAKPAAALPAPRPAPKHATAAPAPKLASLSDTLTGPAMDEVPGAVPVAPPAGRSTPPAPALPAASHPPAAAAKPPAAKPAAAKPAAKPAPAPPRPPALVVTGILQGAENVAILKWSDTKRQVVRTGDHLDGGYVVKEIRADAVVLAQGSHQWVVPIGAEGK